MQKIGNSEYQVTNEDYVGFHMDLQARAHRIPVRQVAGNAIFWT